MKTSGFRGALALQRGGLSTVPCLPMWQLFLSLCGLGLDDLLLCFQRMCGQGATPKAVRQAWQDLAASTSTQRRTQ